MPKSAEKIFITPKDAAAWFLRDMAEVSGYAVAGFTEDTMLSIYATYRPMLTAPDPWYFAGVVALEASKVCDLFEAQDANELLREIIEQMDGVVGREDNDASTLTLLILGRVGLGTILMQRRVPDSLLGKVMMILVGSPSASAKLMPDPGAHKQIRAALKLGSPVWWRMFDRRYTFKKPQEKADKTSEQLVAYEPLLLSSEATPAELPGAAA